MSLALGSSMEASCCVARKILRSDASASSRARTLDSRPTTKGVIMYGKITTSRIGLIGSRLLSVLSFEVSMGSFKVRGNQKFKLLENAGELHCPIRGHPIRGPELAA